MENDILDNAKALFWAAGDDEVLMVKFNVDTGKYSLHSRTKDIFGTDWTFHFTLNLEEARFITDKGLAIWWLVDEKYR